MTRKTKTTQIVDLTNDMDMAAFEILLAIRYGGMSEHHRDCLMQSHFDLSYHAATAENRREDLFRSMRANNRALITTEERV